MNEKIINGTIILSFAFLIASICLTLTNIVLENSPVYISSIVFAALGVVLGAVWLIMNLIDTFND